ncbi:ribonuclease HII [Oscillospiraceae bacterium LTW-04]|nr:ribonuclease HII [Oscillospiraceae bacterium MB24-C1]
MTIVKEKPNLYEMENALHERGLTLICGIDEAGRGPLVGPVCAAAVILPQGLVIDDLNDSKKLTEKKRDALYDVIIEKAVSWAVGLATPQEIDEFNILQATYLAMRRAVDGLACVPDYVLVDGNGDPHLSISTETVVKGDSRAACIAAASVLAKVTRDRLLTSLGEQYPQYGFEKHKGYPTKAHYEAIAKNGVTPEHRQSFLKTLHKHI